MNETLLKIFLPILLQCFRAMTTQFKEQVCDDLIKLKADAAMTENPFDDLVIELLRALFTA